jgi:lysine 2,3-aminomutase
LVAAGLVSPCREAEIARIGKRYAIAITPAIAGLIDPSDARDPIARQFLPDIAELSDSPGERPDPTGDNAHSPTEGIVHRYPDRVLVKLVSQCPVYCRFCFVIFSGGDPLILSPRRLAEISDRFSAIPHIKVMRWHTRVPAVAPQRVTTTLIRAMKTSGKAVFVALHANHPRELTTAARAACARLIDAGIPMLSQTVLLKGVNDDEETLAALMRAFVETRVKPYYLHHLDRAPGTAHFAVPIERGQELMRALRGRLSGLCQPAYVLDIPGGHGKSPIGPVYLRGGRSEGANGWKIEDFSKRAHAYPADWQDELI